ncbi:MAG TPA: AAA family ATPase, partial [Ilumatobacteraceae bacterium]
MARRPSASPAHVVHGALPVALTPFIGRVAEREALTEAVLGNRFVTATGPGGVGKTRLAIAVATDVVAAFAGGAVFVDLVQVTDPELVVVAIADACGVPEQSSATRRDTLLAALRDREVLLVLDNCEHLADASREVVATLLAACSRVKIMATSRLRLILPGERVMPVPGLSLSDDHVGRGDAVELFVALARAGGADDDMLADLTAIHDVCRALNGMALAIELAASRVPSIGVDGLQRSLGSGLDLPPLGHGADNRHRTLRATIEWSYNLLSNAEQRVLRTCSLFAAPFTVDAATEVAASDVGRVLDDLGRLADWSLVTLRPGTPSRYRILEAIRQYAVEQAQRLDELDDLRRRHALWCREALNRLLVADATGTSWCDDVDAITDDTRAALGWAADDPRHRELAVDIAAQL